MEDLKNVVQRFERLAYAAARNGGFWISACGGTVNVAAGEIASCVGRPFGEVREALYALMDWESLVHEQPWPPLEIPDDPRWDIRTIAHAACRSSIRQ